MTRKCARITAAQVKQEVGELVSESLSPGEVETGTLGNSHITEQAILSEEKPLIEIDGVPDGI